jgi:L-amino acid N-acyltransferase YncA
MLYCRGSAIPDGPPMSEIVIRAATPGDIPTVTRIYAHAVLNGTASFEIEPPDEAEMARRLNGLIDQGYPYLVAQAGEKVVGYAYAAPYRARPAYAWSVEDSVYIASDAHRRGVGRALLAQLIEESEQRGFRQMIAVIGDSKQIPSIELHRALGFREIGALDSVGFKFGRWLDTVLMQRPLGEGSNSAPI